MESIQDGCWRKFHFSDELLPEKLCLGELGFFSVTLFRVGFFLAVAYLMVANLARLGISARC